MYENRLKHMHFVQTIRESWSRILQNTNRLLCAERPTERERVKQENSGIFGKCLKQTVKTNGKTPITLRHACARLFNFITAKL